MNTKLQSLYQQFLPYRDILCFVVVLLSANYFWKWTVIGEEDNNLVTWFGINLTSLFDAMSHHITRAVFWIVSSVRSTAHLIGENTIRFDSGTATHIVWSCTALKQSFIWFWIILLSFGKFKKKCWFIPLGWICIYVFNILRIAIITLFIEFHPEWFDMLHEYIFKYLFYGMLFLLWVWWTEKIRN